MMHRSNWDDLRFVLAVAEEGSFAAAARVLGVNHTTVLRRIQAFEESKGVRVFDRRSSGSLLTEEGTEVVSAARKIHDMLAGVDLSISGQERKPEGHLRVTTTDTIFLELLSGAFGRFRKRFPRILLDLSLTAGLLDLTRRDADVAIRPSLQPPDMLIGRRIGKLAFSLYATPELAERAVSEAVNFLPWIGLGRPLQDTPVGRWLDSQIQPESVVFRADTFLAAREAARLGIGFVALPCFVGDAQEGLVRIAGPVPEMANDLWILTHEDLRRSARVSVFIEHMTDVLKAERHRLEGLPRVTR